MGNYGIPVIEAATVDKLIEALTDPQYSNYLFRSAFLLMFPLFTSALEVLKQLISRFHFALEIRNQSISSIKELQHGDISRSPDFMENDGEFNSVGMPLSAPGSPIVAEEMRSCSSSPPLSGSLTGPARSAPETTTASRDRLFSFATSSLSSKSAVNLKALEHNSSASEVQKLQNSRDFSSNVMLKIMGILKTWMKASHGGDDIIVPKEVYTLLYDFLTSEPLQDSKLINISKSLLNTLFDLRAAKLRSPSSPVSSLPEVMKSASNSNVAVLTKITSSTSSYPSIFSGSTPYELLASASLSMIDDGGENFLLSQTPRSIAEQLTLMDKEIFSRIPGRELFSSKARTESANYKAITDNFNYSRTNWIVSEVVGDATGDASNRANRIMFCIELAEACLELCNFTTLFAITAALEQPLMSKLITAWSRVSEGHKNRLNQFAPISKSADNYKRYRMELKKCGAKARIPACSVIFRDLGLLEEGMTNHHNTFPHLVNFRKYRKIYETICDWNTIHTYNNGFTVNTEQRKLLEYRISNRYNIYNVCIFNVYIC